MNIIIVGDEEIGYYLARSLSKLNHNVTVIDQHTEDLQQLEADTDLLTVVGDSSSPGVLLEASVEDTDLLISVQHDEKINLITSILAKKLGAKRTIARINNVEFLSSQNKKMFKDLGVDELVCPERIAAKEIINLLARNAAAEVYDFSGGLIMVYMLRIDENCMVTNKSLNEISLLYPDVEARCLCILRKGKIIIPDRSDSYQINDFVYLIVTPESLPKVKELGGKKEYMVKSAIIAGGGRIGLRTALDTEDKMQIKLIDSDRERCYVLANLVNSTMIINGDANDMELLRDEGLEDADAFIAVTDNTETNILTCLHANKQGVKKTIALVENVNYIDVSQDLGIDAIINKKLITASYIIRFTINAEVTSGKWLSGIDAEIIEVLVKEKSPATKRYIKRLLLPDGVNIGGVIRNGKAMIATGETQIEPGDKVIVFTIPESASKLMRLFN